MAHKKKRKLRSGQALKRFGHSVARQPEERFKRAVGKALRSKLGLAAKSKGSSDHRA